MRKLATCVLSTPEGSHITWFLGNCFFHTLCYPKKKARPLRCAYPGPQYPWWQVQYGQERFRTWKRQWPCCGEHRLKKYQCGRGKPKGEVFSGTGLTRGNSSGTNFDANGCDGCEMGGLGKNVQACWWLTFRHNIWIGSVMGWVGVECERGIRSRNERVMNAKKRSSFFSFMGRVVSWVRMEWRPCHDHSSLSLSVSFLLFPMLGTRIWLAAKANGCAYPCEKGGVRSSCMRTVNWQEK